MGTSAAVVLTVAGVGAQEMGCRAEGVAVAAMDGALEVAVKAGSTASETVYKAAAKPVQGGNVVAGGSSMTWTRN
jgi:hypothetical protein